MTVAKQKKKSTNKEFYRNILADFLIGLLLLIIDKMIE